MKCCRKTEFEGKEQSELEHLPRSAYLDHHIVLADEFKWVPLEGQTQRFHGKTPKMLFPRILLTKLAENQEIELEVHCTKNIGKKHTKWSPVSTAFYRLLPFITIKEPILDKDAVEMKALCPVGVFDIEDIKSHKTLVVKNEKKCVACRACVSHDTLGAKVEVAKEHNKYHFTIESVGVIPPQTIFIKALEVLERKAQFFQKFVEVNK